MKKFNVTGHCIPHMHYMADTGEKLDAIMALVEEGHYFCINRARQYGKTTTLHLLERRLLGGGEYTPISISFEGTGNLMFKDEQTFCQKFLTRCASSLTETELPEAEEWQGNKVTDFDSLGNFLTEVCRDKKYVLIIDEVDEASSFPILVDFLGLLRDKYLRRREGKGRTFHTVILAGVSDIKNLKVKMIQKSKHRLAKGEKRSASPWNIAVDFEVDMSLGVKDISSMLADYENDYKTGMDIEAVATEIWSYTNGYPYLVSRICQKINGELGKDWTVNGVDHAVKLMLREKNTPLFDDIAKNLANNKDLDDMIFSIIALGEKYEYDMTDITMGLGLTFGFLIRQGDDIAIGNRVFEMIFYRRYSQRLKKEKRISIGTVPSEVIFGGRLNMELLIEKFAWSYYEVYRESLKEFVEAECRILFIMYLRALINGGGFCHVESETRDAKRMDVVVDYGADQFIVELKIWNGDSKHEDALDQIAGYLDRKKKDAGYLLTFDFRKRANTGKPKIRRVEHGGKKIFDVAVGVAKPKAILKAKSARKPD